MPSGGYLDEDDWLAVCDLCRERDLFLIYDSAMERLLFDGRPLVHPLRMISRPVAALHTERPRRLG